MFVNWEVYSPKYPHFITFLTIKVERRNILYWGRWVFGEGKRGGGDLKKGETESLSKL